MATKNGDKRKAPVMVDVKALAGAAEKLRGWKPPARPDPSHVPWRKALEQDLGWEAVCAGVLQPGFAPECFGDFVKELRRVLTGTDPKDPDKALEPELDTDQVRRAVRAIALARREQADREEDSARKDQDTGRSEKAKAELDRAEKVIRVLGFSVPDRSEDTQTNRGLQQSGLFRNGSGEANPEVVGQDSITDGTKVAESAAAADGSGRTPPDSTEKQLQPEAHKRTECDDSKGRGVRRSEPTTHVCPVCGKGPMQQRKGRFGPFYSCANYPACKGTRNEDGGVGKQG